MSDKMKVQKALTAARSQLLLNAPYYGVLLMRLKFALAPCGTACTDMRRIYFDPDFVVRLSPVQLEFILQHEVLHDALQHPLRGKNRNQYLYNVAADIVVNSNILHTRGLKRFKVDGKEVICCAPDGNPGYFYTTEQVYDMLLTEYQDLLEDVEGLCAELEKLGELLDKHDLWKEISADSLLSEEWKQYTKEAAKNVSPFSIPPSARTFIENLIHERKIDWRQVLHDFIQITNDRYDFTFSPCDRRFSDSELILPGFCEMEGEKLEKIWFLIDTSGSISDKTLTEVFLEVKACIEQFTFVSGALSFFDTHVTEPISFNSVDEFANIRPEGGGGTSFYCIFEYLKTNMIKEKLPTAIVILTDGCALYPEERMALGIPVLWVIVDNVNSAPWGKTIHIRYKG